MKIHTDFDSLTGLKTSYAIEDDKLRVRYEQDVQPTYDLLRQMRESDEYKRQGIKKGWFHALHIADVDCMRMLTEDGFNVHTASADEILKFCRRNKDKYGHCFAARGNV